MFLSDLSIKRPIMMSMFLLVFVLFGGLAFFGMSLDLFPSVDIPYITVQTVYPGAGPNETESQLSKRIEDAVGSVSKIEEMTSYSMDGVSLVMLKFELGKDINVANQEVKDKIETIINDLPEDAERPLVQKFSLDDVPVVQLVLSGTLKKTELYDLAKQRLKDRFAQIDGVGRVTITGGQEREVHVELDNRIVYQNVLNMAQLSQLIKGQNVNMPGGDIDSKGSEYAVRMEGEFPTVKALSELEVPTPFGLKRLRDIAQVTDGGKEVIERTSYYNNIKKVKNEDVITFGIIKSSGGNTVQIAKDVRKILPEIEKELPVGSKLEIVDDQSDFIQSSVDDTLSNLILGVILTALVLMFFLHDLRSTIIVAVSMPMSIISAFMFMQLSGFTLNMMSLMGLSTAVGVLVTNSVVVLENIFRHKAMGANRTDAASKGTSEIVVAVIASAMTNIAVFLPIGMMSSMVGMFFREFALTVTYATIFSLIISFTLTPMLASLILPDNSNKKSPIGDKLEAMFKRWEELYAKMLKPILHSRKRAFVVVLASIMLFFASLILPIGGFISTAFFPTMDRGDIQIKVELPVGATLDATAKLINEVENRVKQYPDVKQILVTLGRLDNIDVGKSNALIDVALVDIAERNISTDQMVDNIVNAVSTIPNARFRVASSSGMGGEQPPIMLYLMGQDVQVLEQYNKKIINAIEEVPGLVNLSSSSKPGKGEIIIKPDMDKISKAGLSSMAIALSIRSAISGMVASQYKVDGEEYDIRVKLAKSGIASVEDVARLSIATERGNMQLKQLADISIEQGISKIMHRDKFKAVQITGAPAAGVPLGQVTDGIDAIIGDMELPQGYKISWGGDVEMMIETGIEMLRTFLIAVILTYMLLAAILESLKQPLMILSTVPLALIGVFAGLALTGKTFNTISMMAIIMLLGIVVNNAILIMDYANELRRSGKSVFDALIEASPTKLKPILMSTIAIILGMLPMALGFGDAGKEMREPMGIVSIGGLVVSTFLTLFVIPAIYRLGHKDDSVATETVKN